MPSDMEGREGVETSTPDDVGAVRVNSGCGCTAGIWNTEGSGQAYPPPPLPEEYKSEVTRKCVCVWGGGTHCKRGAHSGGLNPA